jgi:YidC/Oxa1 family membrane protein insertase
MNFFVKLFHTTLTEPLLNLLVIFYLYIPGKNLGVAIICLTLLIRALLYPLQEKATKSQIAMQAIQPKIKEVQKKYKDDRAKQGVEMMALYKKEKINPFSGLLVMLVQFPVLVALYRLFWQGITVDGLNGLYSFVPQPETIRSVFLGIDLNQPSAFLAILVGIAFFLQAKTSTLSSSKKEDKDKAEKTEKKAIFGQAFQKQMQYFFPIFIVMILWNLPSALGLYLLVSGVFTATQQYFIKKKYQEDKKL